MACINPLCEKKNSYEAEVVSLLIVDLVEDFLN